MLEQQLAEERKLLKQAEDERERLKELKSDLSSDEVFDRLNKVAEKIRQNSITVIGQYRSRIIEQDNHSEKLVSNLDED